MQPEWAGLSQEVVQLQWAGLPTGKGTVTAGGLPTGNGVNLRSRELIKLTDGPSCWVLTLGTVDSAHLSIDEETESSSRHTQAVKPLFMVRM